MISETTSIKSTEFTYPTDDKGMVEVPDGPGLDVDYDWEYIKDNATGSVHTYN